MASSPWKVKVIERAGKRIGAMLTTLDPFSSRNCERDKCFVHTSGGEGDCKRPGVLYRHVCQAPACVQGGMVVGRWGETGHTAFTRGKKHMEALMTAREREEKADLGNGLLAHRDEDHQFRVDVVEKFD